MNYNRGVCKQCEKWSACFQPCNDFLDAKLEYDLAKKNRLIEFALNNYRGKKIIKESTVMFGDINSLMVYDVSNEKYLQIVNKLIDPRRAIDMSLLVSYMREQNSIYCKEEYLCETCHSHLREMTEMIDGFIVARNMECPHGC